MQPKTALYLEGRRRVKEAGGSLWECVSLPADLWTVLFVFSLSVTNLIKLRLERVKRSVDFP
jgi:hypothetical protein